MSYVDGFVTPVPKKKLDAYKKVAKTAAKIWMEYGAIDYVECIADDVKPRKLTSFPQAVKLKSGETLAFSWITFKSRAHRDRVNAKVRKDPRMTKMMDPKDWPFDGARMIFGGFKVLVRA